MPSSTFFGATLTNLGSLATTFTPAPSCTGITNLVVGLQSSSDDFTLVGYPECGVVSGGGCIPSGPYYDNFPTTPRKDFSATLAYYSPGLACPSGWTTAGTIVGPSGFDDASGVFTQPHFPYLEGGGPPQNVGPVDELVGALAPSETLAWCCPSGMKAVGTAYGCFSSVTPAASYSAYSGVCRAWYTNDDGYETVSTFDGSVYSNGILSPVPFTGSATPSTTQETDFYFNSDKQTIMASAAWPVMLIHKEEDATLTGSSTAMTTADGGNGQQGGETSDGSSSSSSSNNDTDNKGDGESGARRLAPTAGGLWGVAPVALAAGSVFLAMVML